MVCVRICSTAGLRRLLPRPPWDFSGSSDESRPDARYSRAQRYTFKRSRRFERPRCALGSSRYRPRVNRIARGHPLALTLAAITLQSGFDDPTLEELVFHCVVEELARRYLAEISDPVA
jgi:hypothetical protein